MFTIFSGLAFLILPTLVLAKAPVDLAKFELIQKENHIEILWATFSEVNSDYYSIQKSRDVISWTDVGVADAAGNANELVEYSFTDMNVWPLESHYRLVQFDQNGDFYVLATASIDLVNIQEFDVYPNPANDFVTVSSSNDLRGVKFELKDLGGNPISVNMQSIGNRLEINTSEIPNGIYFLQSAFGNERSSRKIIISHNR
ncbi:MAG: T9SS type A sorting domain-containing protein [Bacteroidota bacterium]